MALQRAPSKVGDKSVTSSRISVPDAPIRKNPALPEGASGYPVKLANSHMLRLLQHDHGVVDVGLRLDNKSRPRSPMTMSNMRMLEARLSGAHGKAIHKDTGRHQSRMRLLSSPSSVLVSKVPSIVGLGASPPDLPVGVSLVHSKQSPVICQLSEVPSFTAVQTKLSPRSAITQDIHALDQIPAATRLLMGAGAQDGFDPVGMFSPADLLRVTLGHQTYDLRATLGLTFLMERPQPEHG
jgi:hypothetical protein